MKGALGRNAAYLFARSLLMQCIRSRGQQGGVATVECLSPSGFKEREDPCTARARSSLKFENKYKNIHMCVGISLAAFACPPLKWFFFLFGFFCFLSVPFRSLLFRAFVLFYAKLCLALKSPRSVLLSQTTIKRVSRFLQHRVGCLYCMCLCLLRTFNLWLQTTMMGSIFVGYHFGEKIISYEKF